MELSIQISDYFARKLRMVVLTLLVYAALC